MRERRGHIVGRGCSPGAVAGLHIRGVDYVLKLLLDREEAEDATGDRVLDDAQGALVRGSVHGDSESVLELGAGAARRPRWR